MRFISTLNGIGRSEAERFGLRACDLSVLKDKGFNVPLTFVINQDAFEEFIRENGLLAKMQKVVSEKPVPAEAYAEIVGLFVKSKLPKDLMEELSESYESLSIEPGTNANSLIREYDFSFVTLMRSPSYMLHHEDHEGIVDNVKGMEQLELGIKLSWSTLYSPEARIYREKHSLSERFSNCVIVQKMRKSDVSAQVYSRTDFNEFMIRVKSFKGLQDYAEPILGKDVHEVDATSLLIRNSSINVQEHEVARDFDSEELVKRPILSARQEQKLNEKAISECARLAKRAKSFIGQDIKMYLAVAVDIISVQQVNRMIAEVKTQVVESSEIVLSEKDGSGAEMTEIEKVAVRRMQASDEKLSMPDIISGDEAKKILENEQSDRLYSLDGFSQAAGASATIVVDSGDDIEVFEPAPIQDKEHAAKVTDEMLDREEDLLGEVMLIKEITEKMESLAHEKNKEGYDREARKLRALLARLRQS